MALIDLDSIYDGRIGGGYNAPSVYPVFQDPNSVGAAATSTLHNLNSLDGVPQIHKFQLFTNGIGDHSYSAGPNGPTRLDVNNNVGGFTNRNYNAPSLGAKTYKDTGPQDGKGW
jgi:hypothetical protein